MTFIARRGDRAPTFLFSQKQMNQQYRSTSKKAHFGHHARLLPIFVIHRSHCLSWISVIYNVVNVPAETDGLVTVNLIPHAM